MRYAHALAAHGTQKIKGMPQALGTAVVGFAVGSKR